MRSLTCECGHTMRGQDDDELFRLGREHIRDVHPDMEVSDDELRGLIAAQGRDD